MSFIRTALRKFARDEKGATAIEYGLIAALIAVVCIGGFQMIGSNLAKTLSTVATNLEPKS
ncbi:MAG TPA: Flp family type IVb pilin [Pedomonas sp.]|uniref:Flp family type IVb pilin n=1 Tax=Pedomonas sp. TaxID=2976421 RepID=UPI002F3F8D65